MTHITVYAVEQKEGNREPRARALQCSSLPGSAVDNQMFVSMCSPCRNPDAAYQAYGHSMVVNPLGEVVVEADEHEAILYADIGKFSV